jgi:cyclophilin family peptidyl-prolyl cis-trans isomerase
MPDRRRTRERQLSKLAQRRAAERRKKHRQRVTAVVVGVGLSLVVLVILVVAFTGGKKKPAAAASATPSASASPSATASPKSVACGGAVPKAASVQKKQYPKAPKMTIDTSKKYTMTMMTSCGTIDIELDAKGAPNTVNSLVFLARQKFFDGLTFHRLVQNFVIQGGDPSGDGTGGPGYQTVDAPPAGVTYKEGDMAMAKSQADPSGSSGSQFFIVTGDPSALNSAGVYALVGHVVKGLDVAKKIEALPTTANAAGEQSTPVATVYIEKVTIKETG